MTLHGKEGGTASAWPTKVEKLVAFSTVATNLEISIKGKVREPGAFVSGDVSPHSPFKKIEVIKRDKKTSFSRASNALSSSPEPAANSQVEAPPRSSAMHPVSRQ